MRVDEYLRSEAAEIDHCPARAVCPLGGLCGSDSQGENQPLFPLVIDVEKDGMLWTDLRFEQRVFVARKGVFASMVYADEKGEFPFALYGRGIAIGMAELYAPRGVADMYHLRAIVPGSICSVPAKSLRRRIEGLDNPLSQTMLVNCLTNQSAAAFVQSRIMSKSVLWDRVATMLLCLHGLVSRERCADDDGLGITHGDVAFLVGSDRVSVTRVLHRMRDEGLIDMGYKRIVPKEGLLQREDLMREADIPFCRAGGADTFRSVRDEGAGLKEKRRKAQ